MPTSRRDALIRELLRLLNMRNTQAQGGAGPNWLSPRTLESEINRILTNISALPSNKQVEHVRNIKKERDNIRRFNAEFGPSQYRRQMIKNREEAFKKNLRREVRRVASPPKRKRAKYLRRPAMSPDSNSSQNNLAAKQRRLNRRVQRLATDIAQAMPANKAVLRGQMRPLRRRLTKVKTTRKRLLTQRPPKSPSPAPSNSMGAHDGHLTPPAASGRASGVGRATPRREKSTESGGSMGAARPFRENTMPINWSPGTQYSGGARTPNRTRSAGNSPKSRTPQRRTRSAP